MTYIRSLAALFAAAACAASGPVREADALDARLTDRLSAMTAAYGVDGMAVGPEGRGAGWGAPGDGVGPATAPSAPGSPG
ncbi:MAG: hypothetical protein AAGC56_14135, partial [Pseudomonadota bacterium]